MRAALHAALLAPTLPLNVSPLPLIARWEAIVTVLVATAAPTTITGTVGNVDVNNQTLTIGNDTYYVRTPSNDVVAGLSTGARVEVTYVTEDGRRIAVVAAGSLEQLLDSIAIRIQSL